VLWQPPARLEHVFVDALYVPPLENFTSLTPSTCSAGAVIVVLPLAITDW
jgi:hypothetical protein